MTHPDPLTPGFVRRLRAEWPAALVEAYTAAALWYDAHGFAHAARHYRRLARRARKKYAGGTTRRERPALSELWRDLGGEG